VLHPTTVASRQDCPPFSWTRRQRDRCLIAATNNHIRSWNTVDHPHRTFSGSRQTRRCPDLSYIRTVCNSASVAAKTRHFEDLSSLRVSDLGTVNCSRTSISGWKPICGRFSVWPDSFHRRNVRRLARSFVSGSFSRFFGPPAHRSSTVVGLCPDSRLNFRQYNSTFYLHCTM
jgi:hypothetical protein